jgi:aryl-alcohol dehydrogenase-like predicted oxidoreductase
VGRALDAWVTLFDTADGYAAGESEAILGAALKNHRAEVVIATMVGFRTGAPLTQSGLSRRHILWSVDQSLKRLGTDWIDVYAYGLGLTVWSPLSSGFLSGRYSPGNLADPDNRYSGFDILPFDKAYGFRVVEQLRGLAAAHGASVAQIAIAWLLGQKGVASVLVGATKPHQLADNLGAAEVTLTAAEMAELDAATRLPPAYPNWFIENLADQPVSQALGRSEER